MGPGKSAWWKPAARMVVLTAAVGLLPGCQKPAVPPPAANASANADAESKAALEQRIVAFCGDCHPYPGAELFPKRSWAAEVRRGFDFFRGSDLHLDPPPVEDAIAHYEAAAPDQLPVIPPTPDGPGLARPLVRGEVTGPHPDRPTAIANVTLVHLTDPRRPDILACDMADGELLIRKAGQPGGPAVVLASDLAHPAHAEVADLNGDGILDILVADLGVPIPSDERRGRVLWLEGRKDGSYETRILLSRLGRGVRRAARRLRRRRRSRPGHRRFRLARGR